MDASWGDWEEEPPTLPLFEGVEGMVGVEGGKREGNGGTKLINYLCSFVGFVARRR